MGSGPSRARRRLLAARLGDPIPLATADNPWVVKALAQDVAQHWLARAGSKMRNKTILSSNWNGQAAVSEANPHCKQTDVSSRSAKTGSLNQQRASFTMCKC